MRKKVIRELQTIEEERLSKSNIEMSFRDFKDKISRRNRQIKALREENARLKNKRY